MIHHPSLFSAVAPVLMAALLNLNDATAQAQDAALSTNLISAAALSGSTGRVAVNTAAGNGSTQANIAAISVGGASTSSAIGSEQQALVPYPVARIGARSEIGSDAFRGASGLISVNQSSGHANTQANLAAIVVGQMPEVSIEQLAHVSAAPATAQQATGNAGGTPGQNAVIADSAFAGARGIVQVNQLAGSGNSTANVFALSIGAGIQ
jgi:hypothetical protein